MQDCFRQHPEIYGSELEEEEVEAELTKQDVEEQVAQASSTEAPETMSPAPAEPPVAPLETVKERPDQKAAALVGSESRWLSVACDFEHSFYIERPFSLSAQLDDLEA